MQTTELDGLVKSAQNGSREAFGQIVLRFQDMAFATAYAMLGNPQLAEDAAQEAFLDAYQNLAKLRDAAAFPGWFRRIVVGRTHRQLRQMPHQFTPLEDIGALYAHTPDPATHLETWQLQHDVHHALETLPEAQRLAITLFYIEGYSYREIADYLEVPISTIKKRLFDARSKLKERMIHMVQNALHQAKPSQSDSFSQAVQFFLALRDGDLTATQELVAQNAALLTAKTEWRMALGHHYWPLGSTALHLAAGAGETDVLAWLLAQNPNIQAQNVAGMTPLHIAAVMNQPDAAQLLLAHGANVNMTSAAQQTPLHHAALRNHLALVRLLMQHGADPALRDKEGRTALDWATLRGNQRVINALTNSAADHPIDQSVNLAVDNLPTSVTSLLGRIIEGSGKVLDGGPPVTIPALHDAQHQTASGLPAMLPTGIKIVDLLAPLRLGGINGIFTPLSGVGLMAVIGQIMHSFHQHGGCTVYLFLESEQQRAADQPLRWREWGVDDRMIFMTHASQDTEQAHRQLVKTGLAVAQQLQRSDVPVLLLMDSRLAQMAGMVDYLRAHTAHKSAAAITTLVYGNHTVGVLPPALDALDALLTFDYTRALHRLYPAIDPVRSTSTLLASQATTPSHQITAKNVRRLLQRYADLRPPMDQYKLDIDALWYIEDDPHLAQDIGRARRLDRFLTQSFYGAEPWVGLVGQLVELEDTIAGCQQILAGAYDATPEDAFYFIGTLAEAKS